MYALWIKSFVTVLCTLAVIAGAAHARTIRVDRVSAFIPGTELANDGAVRTDIYSVTIEDEVRPFSINLFGTVYDSFYVNENGVLSFGSPLDLAPRDGIDVFHAGVPVIAPFFADADLTVGPFGDDPLGRRIGRVALTYSQVVTTMFVDYYSAYQGTTEPIPPTNIMQAGFFGSESSTDFRLELNYDILQWESGSQDGGVNGLGGIAPRIGFSDGFGRVYEIPGSDENGVLLKPGLAHVCEGGSLSVGCNDYFFNFRNGLPYFLDGTPVFAVPEPGSAALLLTAFGLLVLRSRRSRQRVRPPR